MTRQLKYQKKIKQVILKWLFSYNPCDACGMPILNKDDGFFTISNHYHGMKDKVTDRQYYLHSHCFRVIEGNRIENGRVRYD